MSSPGSSHAPSALLRPGRSFLVADLTGDELPAADVVLCREVLMHSFDDDVLSALSNRAIEGALAPDDDVCRSPGE